MAKTAFEAFEPGVVVDEFARKIDSLCVWNNTLIAGLSDGSLLFFEEQNAESSAGASISTWQVTRVQKSFGKRSILQLQTLEDQKYLLSLSGGPEVVYKTAVGGKEDNAVSYQQMLVS